MKRLAAALLACALTVSAAHAAPEAKIGTVDLQRAVTESREGTAARADLLKMTEQANTVLKGLLQEADRMRQELEKDSAQLSADGRAERQRQYQKKLRDIQNRQREAQEELKQLEDISLKKILAKFGAILEKIGDDNDYSVILDKSTGVYYAGKKTDVTSLLVKQADKEYQH